MEKFLEKVKEAIENKKKKLNVMNHKSIPGKGGKRDEDKLKIPFCWKKRFFPKRRYPLLIPWCGLL